MQFGCGGLLLRGMLKSSNGSDHLTMSDGVWTDQELCIAGRNWVPFQTLSYATELNLRPFELARRELQMCLQLSPMKERTHEIECLGANYKNKNR